MLHKQVFEMLYHSNGGFGWSELYSMPIWLRRFYYQQLVEQKKLESDQMKKAQKGQSPSSGQIARGPFGK